MTETGERLFRLGEAPEIAAVRALHGELTAALRHGEAPVVDGSEVTRIDTATLQLLAALCAHGGEGGPRPSLRAPSAALIQAAALLGLDAAIGIERDQH